MKHLIFEYWWNSVHTTNNATKMVLVTSDKKSLGCRVFQKIIIETARNLYWKRQLQHEIFNCSRQICILYSNGVVQVVCKDHRHFFLTPAFI